MGRSDTYTTWHARRRASTARRAIGLVGALLLALAALGGPNGAAVAQESGEPEQTELELSKQAYWNNKSAKALPDIVTSEFPPGVVCIVIPDACGDDARDLTEDLRENKPEEDDQPEEPIGPTVQPGTLPTGRSGGVEKYNAAFTFALPDVPEGKEIASFTLVVNETQPTYTYSSPATRQAVLAALVGIQTEDPEAAAAEMEKILQCDPEAECPYPPVDTTIMRVEACPILGGYEEGDAQAWEDRPEVDCIFGTEGERQDDGSWHFDLTMLAQSIAEGDVPNEGILLGPVSAENFAFGDKETTDNAQVSYSGIEDEEGAPYALVSLQEEMSTEAFTLDEGGEGSSDLDASGGASSDGFDGGSSGNTGGQSGTESFSSAPAFESQDTAAPEQEAAPEVAAPADDGGGQQAAAPEMQNAAQPGMYWQIWLLLPLGLAAMYVLSRSLTAEPALANERAGAMTRLIEQRRRASADATSAGMVQV